MWWVPVAVADDVFEDSAAAEARVRELEDYVSRLRGLTLDHPVDVKVLTEDELRTKVSAESHDDMSDKVMDEEALVYRAFDLLPAGYDLRGGVLALYGEQVAGFYAPDERTLFLVKRKNEAATEAFAAQGGVFEDMVTAHELVHALQDQHYDLKAILERHYESDDVVAAVRMLVEGDAMYAMYLDQFRRNGQDLDTIPLAMVMQKMGQPTDEGEEMIGNAMNQAPAVLRDALIAPYIHGPIFVQSLRDQGWTRVDHAFTQLPLSTEQIIHPERYLAGDWPQHVKFEKSRRPLGKEWKPLRENTFGELGFRSFLRHHFPDRNLRDVAAGWDGDRFRVWCKDDGSTALVWYSVWDTEDDAQQWEIVARDWAARAGATVERRGDQVLVTRNVPPELQDTFVADTWAKTTHTEMRTWDAVKGKAGGRF
jgi:hypothetical protein